MKTIIRNLKLWIIAVAAVASAACSDLLDQRPQGQWTIDDIEGGAYFSQVMALYTKARHYNITSGIPAFAVHYYRSEDSRKGSTTTDGAEYVPMYENFQYSAANSLLNPYWTQNYEIINAANTVLDQMQKAQEAGEQLDEAELQCGMEARFFRGWCYFNLVRAFGEVPLVDFAITNSDEANIPKSSVDKIYELIDADLTAAEGLPRRWESKYIGRVTYGAARALHAKTYGQRGLWSQMYQAAKNVIDTRVYNLDTPFDEIFREEGENSSESVWELQCTATVAQPATNDLGSQFCQVQGCRGSGTSNLGWGWHMADQSIVDVFEEGDPRRDETLLYFSTPSKPWPAIAPATGNAPFNEFLVSQDGRSGRRLLQQESLLQSQTARILRQQRRILVQHSYDPLLGRGADGCRSGLRDGRRGDDRGGAGLSGTGARPCPRHQYERAAQGYDDQPVGVVQGDPP